MQTAKRVVAIVAAVAVLALASPVAANPSVPGGGGAGGPVPQGSCVMVDPDNRPPVMVDPDACVGTEKP